jgi:hypothetical protein
MLLGINIHGHESVKLEDTDLDSMEDDPKYIENMIDQSGGLSQAVKRVIIGNGHKVSYLGCGLDGWDIGVVLQEDEALELEQLLITKFEKAISCDMINISTWIPDIDDIE